MKKQGIKERFLLIPHTCKEADKQHEMCCTIVTATATMTSVIMITQATRSTKPIFFMSLFFRDYQ